MHRLQNLYNKSPETLLTIPFAEVTSQAIVLRCQIQITLDCITLLALNIVMTAASNSISPTDSKILALLETSGDDTSDQFPHCQPTNSWAHMNSQTPVTPILISAC